MSLPPSNKASDLSHQQREILDYVQDVVQELSEMSARAGLEQLARDLRTAVMTARITRGQDAHDPRSLS